MKIDSDQVVKILLLSALIGEEKGRTLKDLINILEDSKIIGSFLICYTEPLDMELFEEETKTLLEKFKVHGLIHIRKNDPPDKFVLSENGGEFLHGNPLIEMIHQAKLKLQLLID